MITPKSMVTPKSWHLGFVIGFALVTPAAFAFEAPPADARAVLVAQLEAFERGDAATAWRLVAPEVRERFVTPNAFINDVKAKYRPISHHRSIEIGSAAQRGDEVGMVVTIVDEENDVWSAIFLLARQKDGEWKTSGCMLAPASQISV